MRSPDPSNALGDAAPRWGDRVAVIGAEMVGGDVVAMDALQGSSVEAVLAPSVPLVDLPGALVRLAAGDPLEPCLVVGHAVVDSPATGRAATALPGTAPPQR